MAAARRRRRGSLAGSLFRSYRLVLAAAAVLAIGGLTAHLGCQTKPDVPMQQPLEAGPPVVRVRVVQDVTAVKLTSAAAGGGSATLWTTGGQPRPLSLPAKTPAVVTLGPGGWRVGTLDLGPGELTVEPTLPRSVGVDGRPYRGAYRFVPRAGAAAGAFDVVNHVGVDDYLRGVLAAELYPDFHPEAYRAQAIVARTYAIYVSRMTPEGRHFDLNADVRSQMYGGVKSETAKSRDAADATAGTVVAYGPPGNVKIFKAYYSSCCGGATQTAQDAFGEAAFEPFTARSVGRRCDVAAGKYHARFDWPAVVVPRDELTRRFRAWGQADGHAVKGTDTVRRVDVLRTNVAGRPTHFTVEDARGTKYVLTGEQLRLATNRGAPDAGKLPSGFVTPTVDGAVIRFQNGHGFGHGVGMCQWCIEAQARQGASHDRIVLDAYKGAVLVKGY